MSKFLLTFNDNIFIIIIYSLILLLIAFWQFRKNDDENPIFSCKNLFIMFYYVFIAIGPIYAVITKKYPYNYNLFFIFGISLLFFIIGADFIVGKRLIKIKKEKSKENIELKEENEEKFMENKKTKWNNIRKNSKIVLYFSYICAFLYLIPNISYILQDFENNRVSAMSGNGIIIYFSYAMIPATLILYYCHLHNKKEKKMYLYFLIDIILLLLFGFRSRILELILLSLIIKNDYKKFKLKKLIKYGFLMILAVSFLQAVRMLLSSGEASFWDSIINTICVASINLIHIFRAFPSRVPFQYGYTYLINFQQLLPSSSLDMTMWLKKQLNMQFDGGGVTPTIIGEFYINFGFVGVAIGLIMLGIICKTIDNYARVNDKKINKIVYFIFMFYIARSAAGGIANFIIIMLWFIIVAIAIFNININYIKLQSTNNVGSD